MGGSVTSCPPIAPSRPARTGWCSTPRRTSTPTASPVSTRRLRWRFGSPPPRSTTTCPCCCRRSATRHTGGADVAAELGPNRYGKAGVHLATVARRGDHHDFFERVVEARLEGDFEPVHLEGDNSRVLPTDTMRGSVYALAKGHLDEEIEPFALRYTGYLLEASPAATTAEAWVWERPWERVRIDGQPHPHTFTRGAFRRMARVVRTRDGVSLWAGLDEFYALKTTGSAFSGFLRDRFTTLPETDDRVMATKLDAAWLYGLTDLDYRGVRDRERDVLVSTF